MFRIIHIVVTPVCEYGLEYSTDGKGWHDDTGNRHLIIFSLIYMGRRVSQNRNCAYIVYFYTKTYVG